MVLIILFYSIQAYGLFDRHGQVIIIFKINMRIRTHRINNKYKNRVVENTSYNSNLMFVFFIGSQTHFAHHPLSRLKIFYSLSNIFKLTCHVLRVLKTAIPIICDVPCFGYPRMSLNSHN